MEVKLTVPTNVVELSKVVQAHWLIALGVVVVAILASIAVELIKRRYNRKQQEEMTKKAVAWLLVFFSTVFTVLSYGIFFLQANQSFFETLPYVGQHVVEVLGVAYTLYNLRLNKWYKSFALWASKWTSKKDATPTTTIETPVVAATVETEPVADFS